jgi:hypothetical protein
MQGVGWALFWSLLHDQVACRITQWSTVSSLGALFFLLKCSLGGCWGQGKGGPLLLRATLQLHFSNSPARLQTPPPPTYFPQPPKPPPKPPPTSFFPFRELRPYQPPTRPMPAIFTNPSSLVEIAAMLCSFSNNKALGVDGVTTQLLKSGGLDALQWLHLLIIIVWEFGVAPS